MSAATRQQPALIIYQGIPSFDEWRKARVDFEGWDKAMAGLKELGEEATDLLRRMRMINKRAAKSITGLNKKSRLTEEVQSAMWLAAANEKGEEARPAIESQLLAGDYVMDAAASRNFRISQEWIRELHVRICRPQNIYKIATENGLKEETFRPGEYKHFQNQVAPHLERRPCYAPVDLTQSEMQRLCDEINSSIFLASHPVLQASYALYCLLIIHPFADGNGRVARSLALLFTYRASSIPMLALAQERTVYVSSLVTAAMGEFQPLVDFVQERAISAIRLMEGRIRVALSD